ncbi:hypothetical protein RHGRI_009985 [Rhododendron griersonianum]|uniref:Uncharacterized protein n=1 Tax=Rhododendron griersonianum TaxID=479676 RepID=A0AAV6KHJ2_9ERIC|nr:hypothetical protein RHGRI_009985 [Rhododendron griersonianum]
MGNEENENLEDNTDAGAKEAEEWEDMGNEENENLEDNTDAGAKEPNVCVDEGDTDHEDMDVEVQNEDMGVECEPTNIDDPRNWDKIDQNFIDFMVERGPVRRDGDYFPKDMEGENRTLLAANGLRNWRNIGQRLKNHEASNEHIASMSKWIESERRLKKNETIDQCVQDQIKKEKEHWKGVDGGNTIDFYINVVALSVGLNSLLLHPSSSIGLGGMQRIKLAKCFHFDCFIDMLRQIFKKAATDAYPECVFKDFIALAATFDHVTETKGS